MNTAPAVRSRAQGQINRLGDAIAAPIRVRFARASHRTNGSRLHVIRALVKTKGVGMAKAPRSTNVSADPAPSVTATTTTAQAAAAAAVRVLVTTRIALPLLMAPCCPAMKD